MRPSFLLGSALCVLAAFTAVDARAQCAARLERANHNARDMPENTPYQVHDELSDQSLLAEEVKDSNPAECLKAVARMEALMRRHGKGIVETSGAPAATGVAARPETLDALFPPTPLSRRLAQMRISTGGQTRADALALNEYANASRALGFAIYSGTIESNAAAAAEAVSVTDRSVAAAEATQETMIMINQEGDVLHAQLEDAFRELEAAQRAQDRFAQKYGEFATSLGKEQGTNPLKRLEAAKRNLKNATDRLNKWIERNLEEGFAPGYLGAMRVLEARYKPKFEQIERQCEKMRQDAFQKFAQAALTGRKTTAIEDAGKACSQMERPLKAQSQREEDEIHKKYKLPEKADDDLLTPLTVEPKGPGKGTAPAKAPEAPDDLLTPLTVESKGPGKEATPAKAPEAPVDDLLTPLTVEPKGTGKEAAPAKAPEAPVDDLLAPLTVKPKGAGKGPGSGKPK
ncbi:MULTISPECIES: hypothetical protein [unclassified Sphingomonas]|uniref:hypothetical protein n=1 Tax=Sphingomonas TaxID=13687 RepID=UPI00095DD049|nr:MULTISPECIES: hypothetical protein [unclassified Sphingomonas]MBN8812194.1 hypothetical protein [Sphingomonas sp.]OJY47909.1 MAG: hypothetical protein BGP17_01755 [Sphingomonas sp. 67-41]